MDKSYQSDLNLCHKSRVKITEFINDSMLNIVYTLNDNDVLLSSNISLVSVCTTNEFNWFETCSIYMLSIITQYIITQNQGFSSRYITFIIAFEYKILVTLVPIKLRP